MGKYLVSHPKRLLLVRTAELNAHETTLVVPDLPAGEVEYFRMLVDEGNAFIEHAVVTKPGFTDIAMTEPIVRALSAARPTRICALNLEGAMPIVLPLRAEICQEAQLAAAAVTWAISSAHDAGASGVVGEAFSLNLRAATDTYLVEGQMPRFDQRAPSYHLCTVRCDESTPLNSY